MSASAVGFYGDAGEAVLDEEKPAGTGFLSEVARDWEDAAQVAEAAGLRVARVRIGVVLGKDGGAFPAQRKIFGAGIGGRLGDGKQWTSPVHVEDVVGLIVFLLERDGLAGAFNAVCTQPVRNADFTTALARALHKPADPAGPGFRLARITGRGVAHRPRQHPRRARPRVGRRVSVPLSDGGDDPRGRVRTRQSPGITPDGLLNPPPYRATCTT